MTKGWVIAGNKAYADLLSVLEVCLSVVSKHPVHKVIYSQPDASLASFNKLLCLAKSPFDFSVWLDADTIPNWNVDDLMDICVAENSRFPILQKHITPPKVSEAVLCYFGAANKFDRYGQGNMIMVSPDAKEWLSVNHRRIHEAMMMFDAPAGSYEEPYLNAALWSKNGAKLVNYCTPRAEGYYAYLRGDFDAVYPGYQVTWQAFHNIKWNIAAMALADDIFIRTPETFKDWRDRSVKPEII